MKQSQALEILKTGANVFLTGEPGAGKTYVINQYIQYLQERGISVAVTASTGIAATHVGGVTLHSWSGMGIKKQLTLQDVDRIATKQANAKRISKPSVLIIDEVSMLDGAMLTGVDAVAQEVRRSEEPFGGLQVVLVGDFFQLPPVSREGEGGAQFAFESSAWGSLNPIVCYLSEQHRQADEGFLDLLSSLRAGEASDSVHGLLASRLGAKVAGAEVTRLYSHNLDVDALNERALDELAGDSKAYMMSSAGTKSLVSSLVKGCLSPERLRLKEGAAVMFTKNNPKEGFVNGTLGRVVGFGERGLPEVELKSGRVLEVEPMEWTIEQDGKLKARIAQLPLRLAWAITIHKSQGMSLDAAEIDLRSAFVPGQGYVALSRVRSLEGLCLVGYNEVALRVNEVVQAQDLVFREASAEAEQYFASVKAVELAKMQQNFMRACGGKTPKKKTGRSYKNKGRSQSDEKTFSVKKIREQYAKAYTPWEEGEEVLLLQYKQAGKSTKEMAELLERQPGAIRSRLEKISEREEETTG